MTSAAALIACPHISAPSLLTSTRSVRRHTPSSSCVLSLTRRSDIRGQWRAQSQSEKAPGSPQTEDKSEPTPSWAKPGTEELPPWARNEAAAPVDSSGDLPFPVYLIGSCLVAIAAALAHALRVTFLNRSFSFFFATILIFVLASFRGNLLGITQNARHTIKFRDRVGSIFEYFNQNPIFGVVQPDSPLWAPILGVFVITGFPSAGFLFYKAISLANKASEEADRADGFDP